MFRRGSAKETIRRLLALAVADRLVRFRCVCPPHRAAAARERAGHGGRPERLQGRARPASLARRYLPRAAVAADLTAFSRRNRRLGQPRRAPVSDPVRTRKRPTYSTISRVKSCGARRDRAVTRTRLTLPHGAARPGSASTGPSACRGLGCFPTRNAIRRNWAGEVSPAPGIESARTADRLQGPLTVFHTGGSR